MTDFDDLVLWLRAQLDEEQRIAQAAAGVAGNPMWAVSTAVQWVEAIEPGGIMTATGSQDELEPELAAHIAAQDPAHTLRRIEAEQQVIAMYTTAREERETLRARMREVVNTDPDEFSKLLRRENALIEEAIAMAPVVRTLALAHADRPGYREEWRP